MNNVLIIIPTFNEVENILRIIKSIFSLHNNINILVVDDNSPDGTGDIIKNLDPHSNYISKQELDLISDRMKGNFVGIGVSFLMVGDTVSVVNVIEGGPSKR